MSLPAGFNISYETGIKLSQLSDPLVFLPVSHAEELGL